MSLTQKYDIQLIYPEEVSGNPTTLVPPISLSDFVYWVCNETPDYLEFRMTRQSDGKIFPATYVLEQSASPVHASRVPECIISIATLVGAYNYIPTAEDLLKPFIVRVNNIHPQERVSLAFSVERSGWFQYALYKAIELYEKDEL